MPQERSKRAPNKLPKCLSEALRRPQWAYKTLPKRTIAKSIDSDSCRRGRRHRRALRALLRSRRSFRPPVIKLYSRIFGGRSFWRILRGARFLDSCAVWPANLFVVVVVVAVPIVVVFALFSSFPSPSRAQADNANRQLPIISALRKGGGFMMGWWGFAKREQC